MTLYEFNKLNYQNLPPMTEVELQQMQDKIAEFLSQNNSNYYMMLNNETRYYTVYTFKSIINYTQMAHEIISVAKDLGVIRAVEIVPEKNMVELWIDFEKETRAFLLFDYKWGVVEI